jgi:hypothetical protein
MSLTTKNFAKDPAVFDTKKGSDVTPGKEKPGIGHKDIQQSTVVANQPLHKPDFGSGKC